MSAITIYSTGCPRCKVLIKKMENVGLTKFDLISDTTEMTRLGITAVPMMQVDGGALMNFNEAINWVNQQGGKSGNN